MKIKFLKIKYFVVAGIAMIFIYFISNVEFIKSSKPFEYNILNEGYEEEISEPSIKTIKDEYSLGEVIEIKVNTVSGMKSINSNFYLCL